MKRIILLATMIVVFTYSYGAPADPTPFKVVQPNGDTLTIIHRGDEYLSYYMTTDGIVVEKADDGYWKYVTASNNSLTLSNTKAGSKSLSVAGAKQQKIIVDQSQVFELLEGKRAATVERMNNYNLDDSETKRYLEALSAPDQNKAIDLRGPMPTKGKVKILTILMQYPNMSFSTPPEKLKRDIERNLNSKNSLTFGSVTEYFNEASYGELDMEFTVVGPYTAQYDAKVYGRDDNLNV